MRRARVRALLLAPLIAVWPVDAASLTQAPPQPSGQEHAGHGGPQDAQKPRPAGDHWGHDAAAPQELPPGIPPVTDEDRKAAFPDLNGQHTVHDTAVHAYVLFDQLEWLRGSNGHGASWDAKGWVGGDVRRLWFRSEGDADAGRVDHGEAHLLYGRAIHRWWDVVAGIRQEVDAGPARTWAAVGIQGLAPYWFEVEATAYLGTSGRTHLRIETEYDLLLTNRLVLQPLVELQIYGKADPARGLGAGLSSIDTGLRLRYEIRRELAPYVGVTWDRKFFGTADRAREAGERVGAARLAVGLRAWF